MRYAIVATTFLLLTGCTQWKKLTGADQSDRVQPAAAPVSFVGTYHGIFESTIEPAKSATAWLWDYDRTKAWIDIAEPKFNDLGVIHFTGSVDATTITVSSVTVGACPGVYTWKGHRDENNLIILDLDGNDACNGHVTGHFQSDWP